MTHPDGLLHLQFFVSLKSQQTKMTSGCLPKTVKSYWLSRRSLLMMTRPYCEIRVENSTYSKTEDSGPVIQYLTFQNSLQKDLSTIALKVNFNSFRSYIGYLPKMALTFDLPSRFIIISKTQFLWCKFPNILHKISQLFID